MRYKVPQDVQRADQILWFLTLKQVIILLVGFGVSYWLWTTLSKVFELHQLEIMLICFPALIACAFAFLKIKGIALGKFVLLIIEQFVFRAQRRFWIGHAGDPFLSMTMKTQSMEKPNNTKNEKIISEKEISDLADILDGKTTNT